MSKIVGQDTWNGRITRIYVWYPDEPNDQTLPDWRNDPDIAEQLKEIYADGKWPFDAARYYWNPEPTGQVIVITRLVEA